MKLSTRGEYGLLAVVDLALQPENTAVQAYQIAERQGIPKQYLDQLMLMLRKAGLVESIRGRQGGYRLARAARTITLLDVVVALEGPIVSANFNARRRRFGVHAVLKEVWDGLTATLIDSLRGTTIEDICRNYQRTSSVLNFEI